MDLEIGSNVKQKSTFELTLNVRDRNGKSTGQQKSYSTEDPVKLHQFFIRNSSIIKKKKRNKSNVAKAGTETREALKEAEQHTKMIRKKRKLED